MKNIVISDSEKLEKLKREISKEGAEGIHIITDFDRTLTTAFVQGKSVPSLISVLRDGNYLTKDYAEKAQALYDKYHPIEINPNILLEEKKKAMQEWWATHFKLLIESKLNRKDLENVVKSEKVKLRKGALKFLELLHEHSIPLVIISSGGLGVESISLYLEKFGRAYKNIYIISNSFEWNKEGYLTGFKEPIIHSMNKDETSLRELPVFSLIENRKNVLLLGDTLEDVGMVKGFSYKNLIKIGFLNEKIGENLGSYKQDYDIIILNDRTFNYVNKLLREIIHKKV